MNASLGVYPESPRSNNVRIADIPTLFSGFDPALFSYEIVASADKDDFLGYQMLEARLDNMTPIGSYTFSKCYNAAALEKGGGNSADLFAEGK